MTPRHRHDDDNDNGVNNRQSPETTVTFSLWAVISLVILLFFSFAAYSFNCLAEHSNRLTKTETSFEYIKQRLDTIDQRIVKHMEEK